MDLRQIEYFVVVARQRNFSRAAQVLGVAQPALSQQVKRLEDELGIQLLDRSTRPVTLTDAGEAFQVRAERVLAEARMAREHMREFAGVGRGRLVVGALPALASLWLPAALGAFHEAHPRVEISVREENTEELARLLGTGQLDLALLHAVPGMASGGPNLQGLVMERLFDEELVLIVGASHPLAGRRSVRLAELRNEPFVLLARGSGLAHTVLGAAGAEGFTPQVAAEATSMPTLRALVAAGLGVSVVPRLPARAPGPAVAVLPLRPALPSHSTAVAWRGGLRPSATTEALLGYVRGHAQGLLSR
jgi:DNA-binding transcriptional LysR family regulator